MKELNLVEQWYENILEWLSRQAVWLVTLGWLVTATGCVLLAEMAFRLGG